MRIEDVQTILKLPAHPSEAEAQQMKTGIFKSQSKKNQEKKPPVMPGRFREICPEVQPIKKWDKFWKSLYEEQWLKGNRFKAVHHFNFGSYVPIHDRESQEEEICHLCLERKTSNGMLTHIYNQCHVSNYWWNRIGFSQTMNLREMLAPEDVSFENLRKLNWLFKLVRIMFSRRRQSAREGGRISPLSVREMKKAMRSVSPMD